MHSLKNAKSEERISTHLSYVSIELPVDVCTNSSRPSTILKPNFGFFRTFRPLTSANSAIIHSSPLHKLVLKNSEKNLKLTKIHFSKSESLKKIFENHCQQYSSRILTFNDQNYQPLNPFNVRSLRNQSSPRLNSPNNIFQLTGQKLNENPLKKTSKVLEDSKVNTKLLTFTKEPNQSPKIIKAKKHIFSNSRKKSIHKHKIPIFQTLFNGKSPLSIRSLI